VTITARYAARRLHAIQQMVDKLEVLPLAISEIHRAIDTGPDAGPQAEDAGVRSKGSHGDPTADVAIRRTNAAERHLDDVEANLATLALAAGNLVDVVARWTVSAANKEKHPRCSGGGTVEPWTRPDCTNFVSYQIRADGGYSYRGDGLCDACRMRRHRWLKAQQEAA
jgi:hypothetical protein